ncbi:MAG: FecR domain-containing protein [Sphingobacterium sp.]|jgi:ferric-dicitrate binding protein FerR (iron transport regulator)|nr:FecR domain-containing protein [Sphingobacterium sp.]
MTTYSDMFNEEPMLEELFNEPSFIQLINQDDFISNEQWQFWFDAYPKYLDIKFLARKVYELRYYESSVFEDTIYRVEIWERIAAQIDRSEGLQSSVKRFPMMRWLQYAAILIGVGMLGFWIYLQKASAPLSERYVTSDNKREITLPDGSTLWLNKNSSAIYQEKGDSRTLDLVGEGYLHVAKQIYRGKRRRFVVEHDGFKAEVLGTRFNMINTSTTKLIALDEGSVRAGYANGYLIMRPGEVIHIDHGVLQRLDAQANLFKSWQRGTLELNNTTLKDIVAWMELTYKKKITNQLPEELMEITVSGQIDVSDLQNVLSSLGTLYAIKIVEERDSFVLKMKN